MKISLIYARAANGVIGQGGAMPWHLPEDLAHFRRATGGHPVIMGRKTWDSLPARFRPLPGRRNLVVTRQAGWQADGAERAASLPAALHACAAAPQVWIIGGAQIYAQALPLAHEAVVTEIDAHFDGDAFAPAIDPAVWQARPGPWLSAANGLRYRFVTHTRRH